MTGVDQNRPTSWLYNSHNVPSRSLHQRLLLSLLSLLTATPPRRRILIFIIRLLRLVPPPPRRINWLTQPLPNGVVQSVSGRLFPRPAPEERVATEDGLNVGDVAEVVGVAKLRRESISEGEGDHRVK